MNLLITRHDKIGDFVLVLPLFKAIKEQYPNTKLTALVSKVNFDFANAIDFVDDVILFDKENLSKTKQKIILKKFDASISAYIDNTLGKLLFNTKIKKRVAPATKLAQIFFNKRIKQRRSKVEKREWEYNLDLALAIFPELKFDFKRPLLSFDKKREKRIILHPGFGGSSDGNLLLDDYIKLARTASYSSYEIIFTFGPDDLESKKYISSKIDFEAKIVDSKMSLIEFTKYISESSLFISTSTGPMHLAGLTNTKTISFFGNSLFASSNRWATVSNQENQNNFMLSHNYNRTEYHKIENKLKEIIYE